MTVERGLRLIAGLVVLGSVALSWLFSPWWLLLTAFAGINLLQSGLTDWCPMVWLLEQMGLARCIPANATTREPEAPCTIPGGTSP